MKQALKLIVISLSVLLLAMCTTKPKNSVQTTAAGAENFDWLLGKWKRTNDAKGKETFENWHKISATEYIGVGFTLQNNDTVSKEIMKISNANGKWRFLVKVGENTEFIPFEMAKIKDTEFECKNDSLDFPQLIQYWKSGNKLNALVSGQGNKISFEFEQKE